MTRGPSIAQGAPPNTWHARSGRLSAAKRRALDELAPRWAPPAGPAPLKALDDPRALVVELGAGTGEAALGLAVDRPDLLVIAAEVHRASLATFLRRADAAALPNLRIAGADGRAVLGRARPASVSLIRVFFPDPWPKARQRRRRLVQADFVDVTAQRLAPGGAIELCTDDAGYADQMLRALSECAGMSGGLSPRAERPVTHYERLALAAHRPVLDLRFVRA